MSALGQKQTSDSRLLVSAIHPKADIRQSDFDVRLVPKADIGTNVVCRYSITSSARNALSYPPAITIFASRWK
jgi:hypothetical protein